MISSRILTFLFLTAAVTTAKTADTLTIRQCKALALEQHPLQTRKALAASSAALQSRNLESNLLPRIAFNAVGSWQSDVFRLPIDNPLFPIPEIPRDQYKVTVDAAERIWDGGSDRYQRRQIALDQAIADAQADVDMYQINQIITELYGGILLLQETEGLLSDARSDLQRRLEQVQAMVQQGIALRTAADQVQIQILQTGQQIAGVQTDKATLRKVLALWIGRNDTDFYLSRPNLAPTLSPPAPRPEYRLFELQQQKTELGRDMLRLRRMPRFEAFAQGGLGRPNPFNFFETDWQPFTIVGLRAVWAPIQWGNTGRDKQLLQIQAQQISVQQAALERSLATGRLRDQGAAAKYRAMIANDDAQVALQKSIVQRAEAQVQNGVMTTTDYLTQVRLLTQARITRQTHLIQAWQAEELASEK